MTRRKTMEGCGLALLYRRWSERRAELVSVRRNLTKEKSTLYGRWVVPALDGGLNRMIRSSGPLLVAVGVGGTLWSAALHFVAVLPHLVGPRPLESLAGLCHLLFTLFLTHGGFYNYYKCVYTPPGSPSLSPEEEAQLKQLIFHQQSDSPHEVKHPAWCRKCMKPKPRRTHHCSICNRCVSVMDHHCPWVWNCVGQNNQKYFFLFLFYGWLASLYGLVCLTFPFLELFRHKAWSVGASREAVFFTWIVVLIGHCGIAFMAAFQAYLISRGMTTLEYYQSLQVAKSNLASKKGREEEAGELIAQEYFNEYDQGVRQNWEIFFERRGWPVWWLFSWLPSRSTGHLSLSPDYGVGAPL